MQKKLLTILAAAVLAAAFTACDGEQPMHSDAPASSAVPDISVTTEPTAPPETTESASGDAITSLADWDKLNADGAYSDGMRAFFGRFLGENTTGIAEFDTVRISDYRIARREPDDADYINRLLFTFTVEASGLDTLPPGTYETLVEELRDPTMTFLGDDPRDAAYPAAGEGCASCSDTYHALLTSCYVWNYPAYGAWNAENFYWLPVNYIVDRYGNSDKMAEDTFADLAERLFGFRGSLSGSFRRRTRTAAAGCMPAVSAAAFMPCFQRIASRRTGGMYSPCSILPTTIILYRRCALNMPSARTARSTVRPWSATPPMRPTACRPIRMYKSASKPSPKGSLRYAQTR